MQFQKTQTHSLQSFAPLLFDSLEMLRAKKIVQKSFKSEEYSCMNKYSKFYIVYISIISSLNLLRYTFLINLKS